MNSNANGYTAQFNVIYNMAVYPSVAPPGFPNAYTHYNAYGYSSTPAGTTTDANFSFNLIVQFPIGGEGNVGEGPLEAKGFNFTTTRQDAQI